MRKVFLFFVLAATVISSCKKEEDSGDPDHGGNASTHYAYVRGVILDSVTGNPIANANLYDSDGPFSHGEVIPTDGSDVNGEYIRKIFWYVGDLDHNGTTVSSKPSDSTDIYISAYSNNSCGFVKIKGWQIIENDTLVATNILFRPAAYITTHIKDTTAAVYNGSLNWFYVIGPTFALYPRDLDTTITWRTYPYRKVHYTLNGTFLQDSIAVNSGDTAFVNLFY